MAEQTIGVGAAPEAPVLKRLLAMWEKKRDGREMPARADFDPLEFRWALGSVVLFDVVEDPSGRRFRYRLAGSTLTGWLGVDLTGRFLNDHPMPEVSEFLVTHCCAVVQARSPLSASHSRVLDNQRVRTDLLTPPLSTDGARVDILLGGMVLRPA
jgi:hypothetical protein